MSGIAGMANPFEDISHQCSHICSMSDAIRTRGPNGSGLYVSDHFMFSRRTGISGGKHWIPYIPDFMYEDQEYVIAFTGIIYNYDALKEELESHGYVFKTKSNQEVLAYGYSLMKEDFFCKMNGMFSFALWIRNTKTIILARDHVGARPLYYSFMGSIMLFASEFKGIISHPLCRCAIGSDGLSELICLSPRTSPGSAVIKGIHELRPAHYLKYSQEGVQIKRYWFMTEREHEDDIEKTAENLRELITDAIQLRMDPNMPLCGLLSGGLYSSLITSTVCGNMDKLHGSIYNTWSMEYEKSSRQSKLIQMKEESDIPWVRWACRQAGTRHHYILLSPDDLMDSLYDASDARGMPGSGDYDISLLLLFREIRKDFAAVMTGDCSDEIFGGSMRTEYYVIGKKRIPWSCNLAEKVSVFNQEIIQLVRPYEFIEKCYEETLSEYLKFATNATSLKKEWESEWFSLYWNLPFLMDRLDRMSMAFYLEARVPLCDYRLIEYLWNIPQDIKKFNGRDRGLLRESMRDIVPYDILNRKKCLYPRAVDPQYEAAIMNLLKDVIYDTGSPVRYLLDIKALESLMKQADSSKRRHTSRYQLYTWIIELNHFLSSNNIMLL